MSSRGGNKAADLAISAKPGTGEGTCSQIVLDCKTTAQSLGLFTEPERHSGNHALKPLEVCTAKQIHLTKLHIPVGAAKPLCGHTKLTNEFLFR